MLLLATIVVVIQFVAIANVVIVVIAVAVTCLLTSDDNGDDGDKHDDYYDLSDDDDGDFSSGSRMMAYIYSVLAFLYSTVWVYCFTHIGMNMQKYERVYLSKRACVC